MSYECFSQKVVLVTGATGSFGRKFITTLLAESCAKKVIVFSRDELKQSHMQVEISDPENRLRFFIGDVRDLDRLRRAFHGVDIVVHAAALKQVPALEYNPYEAVKTNVLGSQNVIDAAIDCGVKQVVLISTDKAANPVNLYGATKMTAERLFIQGNVYSGGTTKFAVVRYGNVVGSRGSIVDILKNRKEGGSVRITDEAMTRFWITLDQGVAIVVHAIETMRGGEIFIPKIPSMRVVDLMEAIAPGCQREIIGIRPGEKINEVLITEEESRTGREFDGHFVIISGIEIGNSPWLEGSPLPADFRYASHTNTHWLSVEDIKKIVYPEK